MNTKAVAARRWLRWIGLADPTETDDQVPQGDVGINEEEAEIENQGEGEAAGVAAAEVQARQETVTKQTSPGTTAEPSQRDAVEPAWESGISCWDFALGKVGLPSGGASRYPWISAFATSVLFAILYAVFWVVCNGFRFMVTYSAFWPPTGLVGGVRSTAIWSKTFHRIHMFFALSAVPRYSWCPHFHELSHSMDISSIVVSCGFRYRKSRWISDCLWHQLANDSRFSRNSARFTSTDLPYLPQPLQLIWFSRLLELRSSPSASRPSFPSGLGSPSIFPTGFTSWPFSLVAAGLLLLHSCDCQSLLRIRPTNGLLLVTLTSTCSTLPQSGRFDRKRVGLPHTSLPNLPLFFLPFSVVAPFIISIVYERPNIWRHCFDHPYTAVLYVVDLALIVCLPLLSHAILKGYTLFPFMAGLYITFPLINVFAPKVGVVGVSFAFLLAGISAGATAIGRWHTLSPEEQQAAQFTIRDQLLWIQLVRVGFSFPPSTNLHFDWRFVFPNPTVSLYPRLFVACFRFSDQRS